MPTVRNEGFGRVGSAETGSRERSQQAVSALTGFDPARDVTPIELAGRAMKDAYEYIRKESDPPFEEVKSDYRILAMATALVACEHLIEALREIRSMKTPGANATVRRMAERAELAMATPGIATQSTEETKP